MGGLVALRAVAARFGWAAADSGCTIVVFSSYASLLGGPGLWAYGAACAHADHVAAMPTACAGGPTAAPRASSSSATSPSQSERAGDGDGARVISVCYGQWADAGMAARSQRAPAFARRNGETPLMPSRALDALAAVLARAAVGGAAREPAPRPGGGALFLVCDVRWERSIWRHLAALPDDDSNDREGGSGGVTGEGETAPLPAGAAAAVEAFLRREYDRALGGSSGDESAAWDADATSAAAGLDSLDLVTMSAAFAEAFPGATAPLALFVDAARMTRAQLAARLEALVTATAAAQRVIGREEADLRPNATPGMRESQPPPPPFTPSPTGSDSDADALE